jgi:hypothetical protein
LNSVAVGGLLTHATSLKTVLNMLGFLPLVIEIGKNKPSNGNGHSK